MPPPIDLTGKRLGQLVVVQRGQPVTSASGKKTYQTWQCQCDCGRTETILQYLLPYTPSNIARAACRYTCTTCLHTRTCQVCSATFVAEQPRACCSDACHILHKRRLQLDHYYRRIATDPGLNKRRHQAEQNRAAADPEMAARIAARNRNAHRRRTEKIRADPALREHVREQSRQTYQRHATAVQARRRERIAQRLSEMTDAELETWMEHRRERYRRYGREHRARATPAQKQAYREYRQAYDQQRALRDLASIGNQLIKRNDDDDN